MDKLVDVLIPVEAEAAQALESREQREAVGRYISRLIKDGGMITALEAAITEAKREARANGLTDEDIEAELEAWRAERHA